MIRQDPYLALLADYIEVVETPDALRDVSSTAVRQRLSRIQALWLEVGALVPAEILPMLSPENPRQEEL